MADAGFRAELSQAELKLRIMAAFYLRLVGMSTLMMQEIECGGLPERYACKAPKVCGGRRRLEV